ncbi:hypothetical protein [Nocardioides sp. SYSU D00065]|uniref:hypothetical protein n=1 Tax=Nocardioides sp. SYSU D00065 TaxID=2817378 RepID=UPI001B32B0D9|nr:hypothetical protein [Nocardioides sp. SYSU D00065]
MLTRTAPIRSAGTRTASPCRLAGVLVVLLAASAVLIPAAPARADARISVVTDRGTSLADSGRPTILTLSGSGFQSVRGGFGGVYVAFGWVRDPAGGGWRPSRGGVTGRDYRYVPDSESEDNAGYLRFVAFPGSSTAGEAQAVMSPAGAFRVSLAVPGPTFRALDRNGEAVDVDCRQVTCGVITFGAHGVENARNETFTPVRFRELDADEPGSPADSGSDDTGAGVGASTDGGAATSDPGGVPSRGPSEAPGGGAAVGTGAAGTVTTRLSGRPRVATERATARAGQALAFTGRGFQPGEQVLALLDDGAVALGPLVAGTAGDVAGVMALPADLSTGTHELRLVGAASGARPSERFPVRGQASGTLAPGSGPVGSSGDRDIAAWAFVGGSALALVAALALLGVRLRRRVARPARTTGAVA